MKRGLLFILLFSLLTLTSCSVDELEEGEDNERNIFNQEFCPPLSERFEPIIVDKFQDGGPEINIFLNQYHVIVPEGHQSLAQNVMDILPECYEAIAGHMGYCHPWKKVIIHYGRFDLSRAKADEGVVYIGLPESSLSNLDNSDIWQELPILCGGQSTLAHESVHTFQPKMLPAWLKEGWADYISNILVSGFTYECGETSVCISQPSFSERPNPEECLNNIEYWNLSDPDWSGTRPDLSDGQTESEQSNKHRYYKTGTCFWQSIRDTYGVEALHNIFRMMHIEQRDDLPVFPFSPETNDLLMRTYFVPVTGPGIWDLVSPYGIFPIE